MIFSYKRLISEAGLKNVSVEEICKAINSIGFEVEGYEKFTTSDKIKFGYVLETKKNENADRLTVCKIDFGSGDIRIIQTTATNVVAGKYLMAFVDGSIASGTVIKSRDMQGYPSQGMLVGLGEVGFDEELIPDEYKDQIFTFDGPIDLSLDPMEYFELNDYLIDVTILSNRADAQCYLIMSRELAAYFGSKPKSFSASPATFFSNLKVSKNLVGVNHLSYVEVMKNDLNVSIHDKMLLWKHKIKTFNAPIDLSNLVLLYASVPCHTYNLLSSNEFSTTLSSEELEIIGGKKVKLENNLVVKNGSNTVALAQVIGTSEFEYNNTKPGAIFELASFDLKQIRQSVKQTKLETNAALRGFKEISGGQILLAYDYLFSRVKEHSQIINKPKVQSQAIFLDEKLINHLAGFSLTKQPKYQEVIKKLEILGFKYNKKLNEMSFPTYRYDLFNLQDLIEEIFRFYGYDNFQAKEPTISRIELNSNSKYEVLLNSFASKNYMNARTFTLISEKENIFNPFGFENTINVLNSKTTEHTIIRNSMIISLYKAAIYNKKQGIDKTSFFELGSINTETNVLGLCSNEKSFDEIANDVLSLTNKNLLFKKSDLEIFNNNVSSLIYCGETLMGYIAKLNPFYLKSDLIFAEILIDKLDNNKLSYKPYNKQPLKSRDITFTLQKNESIDSKLEELKKIKGIFEIKIIDVYKKDDNTQNITVSVLIEDWATKKFDQIFNK
ncbi:phenylalanine--tRNA ligase subunit beta [Metamycoplasma hyosynoviae]|uniref:phenylalanine--tRNA ligase subunit beta n=1 Tax=Metamycoplasma hyosynoviae TaxID=29559 RepID=UPI00235A0195|nr:phenylalanine--tRNA ligase subunit beta [Metamycoplasma hyosynoviae]MDC8921433.1 phenylalanine--tRNA ligase subunit beta [Metamycoplasma hyosynoviae]